MGVAAGTTHSMPEYEAVQIRTGPGDQEEIGPEYEAVQIRTGPGDQEEIGKSSAL